MSYQFKATETFWQNFYSLSDPQKESVRRAWQIFKQNPFDPRLRPHKIHSLSARYKKTIYSAVIEGDLRVVCCGANYENAHCDSSADVYQSSLRTPWWL